MEFAIWIVAGIAALANIASGAMKVFAYENYAKNAAYTQDFRPAFIRTIGGLEAVGGIGLILPQLTGILPWLTIVAGFGLAIIQAGAIVIHLRRKEYKVLLVNVILLVLPLFVALGWLLWA